MKRAVVVSLVAIALLAAVLWLARRSDEPQRAFETLSNSKLMVNSAFQLENVEPLPDGLSDRVGTIHASYRGPDEFDALKLEIYKSESAAVARWRRYVSSSADIRTSDSTRQPRFRNQLCTLQNQTIKCAVRMYEAVIKGAAGGTELEFDEASVKANAQVLLMAGVKHWLEARGLGLPEEQEI